MRGFGFTCLTCTIMHVLTEVQRLLDHKICILLHIITMTKQHTTGIPGTAPVDSSGAGAPEFDVEITPQMMDAGIYALSLCDREFDLSEQIVSSVFRAMVRAGADLRDVSYPQSKKRSLLATAEGPQH